MAFSYQRETAKAGQTDFTVRFEFFDRQDVRLFVDGTLNDKFYWISDYSIRMDTPFNGGEQIRIQRITDMERLRVIFHEGAPFLRENLDEVHTQLLYIIQESSEGTNLEGFYNDIDMHGNRITNLGNPIDDTDAANKKTVVDTENKLIGITTALDARISGIESAPSGDSSVRPWVYVAKGGETSLNPNMKFSRCLLFINGVTQYYGVSYSVKDNVIRLTKAPQKDDIIMALCGEYPQGPHGEDYKELIAEINRVLQAAEAARDTAKASAASAKDEATKAKTYAERAEAVSVEVDVIIAEMAKLADAKVAEIDAAGQAKLAELGKLADSKITELEKLTAEAKSYAERAEAVDLEVDKLLGSMAESLAAAKVAAETAIAKAKEASTSAASASAEAKAAKESASKATNSAAVATEASTKATKSEAAAKTSATDADVRAKAAKASEVAAKASEVAAKSSETKAKSSETASKASQDAASKSAANAKDSENSALTYKNAAEVAITEVKKSQEAAKASEDKAKASETNSKTSENKAKESADAALVCQTKACDCASKAKASETSAKASQDAASKSATAASTSSTEAKTSAASASTSSTEAKTSATAAKASETKSISEADRAKEEADRAEQAASEAKLAGIGSRNFRDASKGFSEDSLTSSNKSEASAVRSESSARASAISATTADEHAKKACECATRASTSSTEARASATTAKASETKSTTEANRAKTEADRAEAAASSTGGIEPSDLTQTITADKLKAPSNFAVSTALKEQDKKITDGLGTKLDKAGISEDPNGVLTTQQDTVTLTTKDLAKETGNSHSKVMTQKAVSDKLAELEKLIKQMHQVQTTELYSATAGQTEIAVTNPDKVFKVYVNGLIQYPAISFTFDEERRMFVFTEPLAEGDRVMIEYCDIEVG